MNIRVLADDDNFHRALIRADNPDTNTSEIYSLRWKGASDRVPGMGWNGFHGLRVFNNHGASEVSLKRLEIGEIDGRAGWFAEAEGLFVYEHEVDAWPVLTGDGFILPNPEVLGDDDVGQEENGRGGADNEGKQLTIFDAEDPGELLDQIEAPPD